MRTQEGRVVQVSCSSPGGVPKHAVPGARVGTLGLEGDGHLAAPSVHGGPDRAVCLYGLEAIARVAAEGHQAFPGAFGENLTMEQIDLALLLPGDRLTIGGDGLVLELTGPTAPCRNQARWFRDGDFSRISAKRFPADSRWYARVLTEGTVRPGDAVRVERATRPHGTARAAT